MVASVSVKKTSLALTVLAVLLDTMDGQNVKNATASEIQSATRRLVSAYAHRILPKIACHVLPTTTATTTLLDATRVPATLKELSIIPAVVT